MRRPALLLAVVIGLVCLSAVAIALRPAVLGLDLQGGVEVVLQGEPTEVSQVTKEAIDRSVEIIRSRVDAFGVAEPEIQTQGSDQIAVSLPGADNPEQVVNDLIQPAQLTFINFEANVVNASGTTDLYKAVKLAQRTQGTGHGKATFYAFDAKNQPLLGGAGFTDKASLRDSFPDDTPPKGTQVLEVPKGVFLAYQEEQLLQTRNAGTTKTYFVFKNKPGLVGADVTGARSEIRTGQIGGNQRIVTLSFTGAGRRKFAEITRELAQDGQIKQTLQHFAIILDGKIVSNPSVDYKQYPTGIDGDNGAEIDGDFSKTEADTLAKQINSGALPIDLKVISQKQVSATLGKESLHQGLIAGIAGLAIVVLSLIAYYRFLGIIAAAALIIYAILLYAVIVLVPVTMTLPGIAGIILTIGVASDANVVIFERVREEARAGKSPRASVLAGYKKGITAIIDANVVTLATALVLFLFATAGVKGFAFTLGIGVVLSLFTAVVATRAAFNVLAETRFLRDDRYMGLHQREIRWKFDMVGKWKMWLAIAFVPMAIGAFYIGLHGLNLGLDFESGTRITTSFVHQPSEDAVRQVFADQGYKDAVIQSTSENVDGKTVQGFQMQTETLQPPAQAALKRALNAKFGINEKTYQLDLVGPTFGRQIIHNAIYAILISFAIIIIYLWIRFEYKMALPALLSVVHDIWLAISVYSVTGHEVTSATVAALLTILGYSLYDVVIVFDRIRENVPIMRRATYREIVNTSVHEVLNRSIITSITTLLPLVVLFIFGGDTLKDFALALIIGILAGGISSIAIAAPILALWKEREPEIKRRAVKAQRRTMVAAGDADVVDLDALSRAEASLDAELRLEEANGRRDDDDEPDELEELEEEPLRIGAGEEPEPEAGEPETEEPEAEEPDTEEPDTEEPETEAGQVADEEAVGSGDGAAGDARANGAADQEVAPQAADGDGESPRRRRPSDPDRVRRHRNVQKRRRR